MKFDGAVLSDARIGLHLTEKGRVLWDLVVHFSASVERFAPLHRDGDEREVAVRVKDHMSLRIAVGDPGVVGGNDHGGVAQVQGRAAFGGDISKVQRRTLTKADGPGFGLGGHSVKDATSGVSRIKEGDQRFGVAVFSDSLEGNIKDLFAGVVGIEVSRVDADPDWRLASAFVGGQVLDGDGSRVRVAEKDAAGGWGGADQNSGREQSAVSA